MTRAMLPTIIISAAHLNLYTERLGVGTGGFSLPNFLRGGAQPPVSLKLKRGHYALIVCQ